MRKIPSGLWAALISVAIVTVYHFTFNSPKIGKEAKEQEKTTGQKQEDVSVAPPKEETEPPKVVEIDTSDEQSITAMAKQVTVVINGQNPGSGVILGKKDKTYSVLTAAHVVATQDEYEIITADGTKHSLDYRTVKKMPNLDLAVVEFTSNKNYPIAKMGNSNGATEGATIYISGWPHPGQAITQRIFQITSGKISGRSLGASEEGYELVYTNITRSGMSGGPVFDEEGDLIGIHGRAEGENIVNPDTGNSVAVKSGFNLGIPINIFYQYAELSVLPKNPSLARLFWDWANEFHKQNRFPEALAYYEKVLALERQDKKAVVNIGLIEYERGNVEAAIQRWQQAVQIAPDDAYEDAEAELPLAVALYAKGDRQRGLAMSSGALQWEGISAIDFDSSSLRGWFWGKRLVSDSKPLARHFMPNKTFKIPHEVRFSTISPQGRILGTQKQEDGSILLIDLESGQEIRRLSKPKGQLDANGVITDDGPISFSPDTLTVSPDGKIVASIFGSPSGDKSIILWDLASGKEIRRLSSSSRLNSLAFSPDSKILASSSETAITLWDTASGQKIRTLTGHSDDIKIVTFSRDGQMLAGCNSSGTLKLWNRNTCTELKTFNELVHDCYSNHPDEKGFDLSPDGKTIAVRVKVSTNSDDQVIKLLNISNGQELRTLALRDRSEEVQCFAFSPDGQTLVSFFDSSSVLVWDVSTGRERRFFVGSLGDCRAIAVKPDGQTLIAALVDAVNIWQISKR